MTARRLDIQRIKVNAQGYDSSDAYWGAGPDVFIATTPDGSEEITVRARNVTEARRKIDDELERKPGEVRSGEPDLIGGNSPHKSRYGINWLNPVSNERIRIRITHAREYLSSGSDHLEIESIKPKRAPLPITETGYRSHFLPALDLINAGGPVKFVTAWIAQEAKGKAWTKAAVVKAQGDLFSWAEANGEVSKRKQATKSKRPDPARQTLQQGGKPSRRHKPDRDPA
ncbi:MAG: hypothetical protein K2Y05_05735 [Hyphomicrobiaceae bacterium]|nr:hypothetical protein [Hyphomicrobiaceae bacterium]